ncbi:hypothetical protein ACFWY9_11405 [Amycolatopsis sp. NPDC059027]|uniref:hypothetical protein n=1 Tax=Amycolatopsis sp. NPDC059027 TaxID=3346709 RepID=UPI00366E7F8D
MIEDQADSGQAGDIPGEVFDPLDTPEEFDEAVAEMVAEDAPRLFAVVQVYGDRVDARVGAWGMAFENRAEVVTLDGRRRLTLRAPERALRWFGRPANVTAHLQWVEPASPDGL